MSGSTRTRLRRREKLTSGAEYRRVFRQGIRMDGPFFLLVAAENDRGYSRLGLAAGRKIGSAVVRNRAKRRLRESFRNNKLDGSAFDLVLVPKREIVEPPQGEVEREYRERLRRLVARRAPGKRRPPPAAAR